MFVLRKDSEKYYINIAVSAVLTILVTRIYLEIFNYPMIANDVLHLAHLLWGGLFLFVGGIFLLVFKDKKMKAFSSFLIGIGWGLFLDEIGKFITMDNDYFFRPAAPLIYLFSLLSFVPFYFLYKKKRFDEKEKLYSVFEKFEEIIENDFDPDEKKEALDDLDSIVKSKAEKEIKDLAKDLALIIRKKEITTEINNVPTYYKIASFLKKEFRKSVKKSWVFYFVVFSLFISALISSAILGVNVGLYSINIDSLFLDQGFPLYIAILGMRTFVSLLLIFFIFRVKNRASKRFNFLSRVLVVFLVVFVDTLFMYFHQFGGFFIVGYDLFIYLFLLFL